MADLKTAYSLLQEECDRYRNALEQIQHYRVKEYDHHDTLLGHISTIKQIAKSVLQNE